MSYFLSPALAQLRGQIAAAYPHRDRTSDGWIGDTSHAARPSDHNPDWSDGGIVRALDVDEDLVIGMTVVGEAQPLADALLRDRRTRYVIYEGRIAYGQHVTNVTHGWRPYHGVNAHRHHIHISVRDVGGYDRDDRAWALPTTQTTPKEPDMDKHDKAVAKRTLDLLEDLHSGVAPGIPITTARASEKITLRAAIRDVRIAVTRQLDDAVEQGVAAALADVTGVDKAALTKGVVAEVRKVLDAVEGTEYVLTPKES